MEHHIASDTGPFAIVPVWVLESELSDRAVRLYGVLARYADNDTGACWPSRQTLAAALGGCSLDSVDRAVRELVQAGAVAKERRRDDAGDPTSNLYVIRRVNPAGVAAPVRPPSREGAATGSRTDAALTRPTGTRPRDEVWDALVAVWGEPATGAERKLRGQVVRDLKREGLTDAGELVRRGRLARSRWAEATPRVMLTRWTDLGRRHDPSGLNADRA